MHDWSDYPPGLFHDRLMVAIGQYYSCLAPVLYSLKKYACWRDSWLVRLCKSSLKPAIGSSAQVSGKTRLTYPMNEPAMLVRNRAPNGACYSFFWDLCLCDLFDERHRHVLGREARVLEYLIVRLRADPYEQSRGAIGAQIATGVGWVYLYALVDKTAVKTIWVNYRSPARLGSEVWIADSAGVSEGAPIAAWLNSIKVSV